MGTFNASSDRERGFRIPWYAAVPAVGSLGLAAFSLSRLPGTRRLIHSAKRAQADLPRLNTQIRDWERAKQRFEALADARDHIFAYGKNPDPKIDITKYYRQFLAKGGKIQDFMLPAPQPLKWRYKKFPAKGGAPQIGTIVPKHDGLYGQELYVPYKNEGIFDIDESLRVSAEQLAEAQRKKARWLAHIAEAEARVEAQNARLIGSAVLGVPAAVGMLYGNRGNWRNDKQSSLYNVSDKIATSDNYDGRIAAGLIMPLGVYGYNAGIKRAYQNRHNKIWGEAFTADAALDDALKLKNILDDVMYTHPKFTGADILKNGVPIPRYQWKTIRTRSDLLDSITQFKDLGYDISQLEVHPDYLNLKNSIDHYKNVEANFQKLQEDAVAKIRKAGILARKDRVYKVLERLQPRPRTAVISGLLGLGGLGYAGYHAYRALQDN